MSVSARPSYRTEADLIAEARERLIKETAEHEMTVLLDDGVYRHLRFRKPGTSIYCFDIVTWPGFLAITGDCGDFLFARTLDMFEFFSHGRNGDQMTDVRYGINPGYWAEKLQAPRPRDAQSYSYDTYCALVQEWLEETVAELQPGEDDELDQAELDAIEAQVSSLRAAVDDKLLAGWRDAVHSEHAAHQLLRDFEHDGFRIYDTWEWNLREYDWQFLFCCWAIVWGIQKYNAQKKPAPVSR